MSSVPTIRDVATHLARAEAHEKTGDALRIAEDEWLAVAYFYSAYHLIKAALNADPIFESLAKLQSIDANLTLDARFATHHSGGFTAGGRSLGVNEIVFKLYKDVRLPYTRLHMASNHVRYGKGLGVLSPITSVNDFHEVRDAFLAGSIVAQAQ